MPDGAMEKIEELENEIAILFAERETAWQQATTATGRVNALEREKKINKPIVRAYWNMRSIIFNASPQDAAAAIAKLKIEADIAANGQRQASEGPGDEMMIAAQQVQAGALD